MSMAGCVDERMPVIFVLGDRIFMKTLLYNVLNKLDEKI
jgi:hypothetical protein